MIEPLLVDTGPLVAILSKRDQHHVVATGVLKTLSGPLLTTWPVITEAAWLLRRVNGGVGALLRLVELDDVKLVDLDQRSVLWIRRFLHRFASHQPQLADASQMYLSETLGTRTVFTFDRRDFGLYVGTDNRPVEIVPAP